MTYAIHILRDTTPENPWTSWDGQPPLLVVSGQHTYEHGLDAKCPPMPIQAVRAHWPEMLGRLIQGHEIGAHGRRLWFTYDTTWRGLMAFARAEYDTHGYPLWEVLADAFNEHVNGEYLTDRIELLAEVYEWLGMPAVITSASGYSQGDYIEGLLVATPEWRKEVGNESLSDEQVRESLRSDFDTYAAYAFGDVYGWVLTEHNPDHSPDAWWGDVAVFQHDGETKYPDDEIDSCWGYYGANHAKSGLRGAALDAVAYETQRAVEDEARADAARLVEQNERRYWAERDVMTRGA